MRIVSLVLTLFVFTCAVSAQVFVDENFDQYLNDAAFETNWAPSNDSGILVPRTVAPFPPAPFDGSGDAGVLPPVEPLMGQAVAFNDLVGLNEWQAPFSIAPSATEAVRYSADIFDFVNGNRRFSVGLRNGGGANIFELGYWNANTYDPTDPINIDPMTRVFDQPTTGYAYRVISIDSVGGDLALSPNWQYFPLDAAFDDVAVDHNGDGKLGNGDGLVNAVDVGPGWHTFSATIETDQVTLELDLFRDGSIDSTVEWDLSVTADPFTSLRLGSPSGVISMNEFTMVDNVTLELIPIGMTVFGDYNNDGIVSAPDLDLVLNNWGVDSTGNIPAGWVNDLPVGIISAAELDIVLNNWGNTSLAVPEPTSAWLVLLGLAMFAKRCRH